MNTYICLDIGGTKVALHIFNNKYALINEAFYSTKDLGEGSLKLLDSLEMILQKNIDLSTKKIGISINAAVNNNVILKSSVLGIENFQLGKYLEDKYKIPSFVENDVIAFTKAELHHGVGKKHARFAVLSMGTGTRIVYCQNGTIVNGYKNVAGEISQLKIYVNELEQTFLLDNLISGRGIEKIYNILSKKEKSAKEIFASSDAYSKKTLAIFKKKLVWLLELIAYVYNPEIVVFSGSIFKAQEKFLPDVKKQFYENNFDFFHYDLQLSNLRHGNALGTILP